MALKTDLHPGETVVRDSRANLQRGAETVGGHLYLTDQRLIFESHAVNVQRGATEIALADVADARKVWTKFLGAIPLAPNSIAVRTTAVRSTASSAASATTGSPRFSGRGEPAAA